MQPIRSKSVITKIQIYQNRESTKHKNRLSAANTEAAKIEQAYPEGIA